MAEEEPTDKTRTEKTDARSEKTEKKSATTDKKAVAKEVVDKIQKLRGEKLSLKQAQKLAKELKISPGEAKKIEARIEADLEEEKVKARKLVPGLEEEEKKLATKLEQAVNNPPTERLKADIQQIENLQHSKVEEQLVGAVLQVEIDRHEEEHGEISLKTESRKNVREEVVAPANVEQMLGELQKIQSKIEALPKDEENSEERTKLIESLYNTQERLKAAMREDSRAMYADPARAEMSGYEIPPSIEKEGWEHTKNWFLDKLKFAEEKQPNQSFESNWRIIYPMEQVINSMATKVERDESFVDPVDGQTYKYAALSKELNSHLESRRNRHNHSYVWSRASGTSDFIGAAHMLQTEYIDFMLKIDDRGVKVADVYRELESDAKEYVAARNLLDIAKDNSRHAKDKETADLKVQEAKDKQDAAEDKIIKLQQRNWAGRIATGLWCALGGAAHYDVMIQESGDFFCNRVYNFDKRVANDLRTRYSKLDIDSQDKLVRTVSPAMNLGIETFWETTLDSQYKQMRGTKAQKDEAFQKFLDENKVKGVEKEKPGKWDYKKVDLSEAKLENFNLGQDGQNAFKLADNQLMIQMLDVNDANATRKAMWDPGGYVDRLDAPTLGMIYPVMNYLKGDKRSEWFKKALQATIEVNKEPLWEIPKPDFLNNSLGKSLFKRKPWNRDVVDVNIDAFRRIGALNSSDGNELVDDYIGKAPTRFIRGTLFEWLKIIFGALNEGRKAMEKSK